MPIPDFDEHGFLPEGIHDCSFDDVASRFGCFQRSDRRCQLCEKLKSLLDEVAICSLVSEVIVDGSFVTSKEEPNDIDLVLVLRPDHDFSAELLPIAYGVLSRRRVRRKFQFDVLVARSSSKEYPEYCEFFQQVRDVPGRRKGILRVIA